MLCTRGRRSWSPARRPSFAWAVGQLEPVRGLLAARMQDLRLAAIRLRPLWVVADETLYLRLQAAMRWERVLGLVLAGVGEVPAAGRGVASGAATAGAGAGAGAAAAACAAAGAGVTLRTVRAGVP